MKPEPRRIPTGSSASRRPRVTICSLPQRAPDAVVLSLAERLWLRLTKKDRSCS